MTKVTKAVLHEIIFALRAMDVRYNTEFFSASGEEDGVEKYWIWAHMGTGSEGACEEISSVDEIPAAIEQMRREITSHIGKNKASQVFDDYIEAEGTSA